MAEKKVMTFADISKIDVGEHIEKKMGLSYLSWAWAYQKMKEIDENATYEIIQFVDHDKLKEYAKLGVQINDVIEYCYINYQKDNAGAYVECAVTLNFKTISESLPVMNFKNQSMTNPSSMDINKAHKRCFVKALAHHGLGLYIYAGEDLPEAKDKQGENLEFKHNKPVEEPIKNVNEAIKEKYESIIELDKQKGVGMYDTNEKINEWVKENGNIPDLRKAEKHHVIGWLVKLEKNLVQYAG